MHSLFRDQKKYSEMQNNFSQNDKVKALKSIYERQERKEDIKDIRYIDKLKEEKAMTCKVAHQVERKNAIANQKLFETRVAASVAKQKEEELRAQKLRQLLRENNPEIRELQRQLLEARVSKGRAIQQAHRLAAMELKDEEERTSAETLAKEIEKEEQEDKVKLEKEHLARKQYHAALDDQIKIQVEINSKGRAGDCQQESKLIDEMVKKVNEEALDIERKKIAERKKYKKQIAELEQAKLEIERIEQEKRAKDEEKQAHFRLMQEYRTKVEDECRNLNILQQDRMRQRLLNNLEDIQEEKATSEELRIQLSIAEKDLFEDEQEKRHEWLKYEARGDTKNAYAMQKWIKQQREQQEKKEDELFRKKMMDRLYAEDKLSLLSDAKRRQKQKEHGQFIRKMMEDRRAAMIEKRQLEMVHYEKENELIKQREILVAEEKRRILMEDGLDLLGFLPKRILETDEDVAMLGENFKRFYRIEDVTEE